MPSVLSRLGSIPFAAWVLALLALLPLEFGVLVTERRPHVGLVLLALPQLAEPVVAWLWNCALRVQQGRFAFAVLVFQVKRELLEALVHANFLCSILEGDVR